MINNELQPNLEGIATAISTLGQQLAREKRMREAAEKHAEKWKQDFDKAINREFELRQDRYVWRTECESWRQNYHTAENSRKIEAEAATSNFQFREILEASVSELRDELEDSRYWQGRHQKELRRLKSSSQWAVTCEGMDKSLAARAATILRDNTDDPMIKAVPLAPKEDTNG